MGCDNGCGCGGCHGEKPNEPQKDGRSLAKGAIDEIKGRRCSGYSQDEMKLSESVDSFLKECTANDVDPMQVVAQVASKEGVMIGDPAPENAERRWVYDILRAVVKRVVNAFLDSVAENYGLGKVDLAGLAADGPDEPPQAITVRVVPIRIRYA